MILFFIVGICPYLLRVTVHGQGRGPAIRISGHTGPAARGPRIIVGQNTPWEVPAHDDGRSQARSHGR